MARLTVEISKAGSSQTQLLVRDAGIILAQTDFEDKSLAWRKDKTPYRVFIAEFLLVRTRTDVVTYVFEEFIKCFPTIESVANASEAELDNSLRPLGLKKRIALLKRGAQFIVERHNGEIPSTVEALLEVPGLGRYTAAAIAAFAFGHSIVPADVNILRFVSRLTELPMGHETKGSQALMSLLPLLAQEKTGLRPQNLLDFTRTICRPNRPRCEICPLRDICAYAKSRSSQQ